MKWSGILMRHLDRLSVTDPHMCTYTQTQIHNMFYASSCLSLEHTCYLYHIDYTLLSNTLPSNLTEFEALAEYTLR